jgi:uncharacterized membrane protein
MHKGRLEAFSDGVLAIIITIMVLELVPPHGAALSDLAPLYPKFISYVISFIYVAIYWNNHHHLMQAVKHVDGRVLWANMHLLFWLSLIPFTTAWMGENHFAQLPVILYGVNLLLAGVGYYLLTLPLLHIHGKESTLALALGRDLKGKISLVLYVIAIALAFVNPLLAGAIYVAVAIIWLVPDRRIEKHLNS